MQVEAIDFNLPMQMTLSSPTHPTREEEIAIVVEDITEENATLRQNLDKLAKEKKILKNKINSYFQKNSELFHENKTLQEKLKDLHQDPLQGQLDRSKELNFKLQQENFQLMKQNRKKEQAFDKQKMLFFSVLFHQLKIFLL